MSDARFEATITANDEASAKIALLSANIGMLQKKMGGLVATSAAGNPWASLKDVTIASASIRGLKDEMAALKQVGGEAEHDFWKGTGELVHSFNERLDQGLEKIRHFGEKLGEIITPLAGLGVAGSLGGAFELAAKATDHFFMLEKQSKIVGMSARDWQKYQFIAKMTDTDVGKMTTSFQRANANIGAAAMGHLPVLKQYFDQLGISLKDSSGHMRTMSEILPLLFKAFRANPNTTAQGALARELFGRGGLDLETMFNLTDAQLKELIDKFNHLSYTPDAGQTLDLTKYHESWIEMDTAVESLVYQLGIELAPKLGPIVDQFTEFLSENHAEIAQGIADGIGGIAQWIERVDWKQLGQDTEAWATALHTVWDDVGGLKTVLEAMIGLKVAGWAFAVAANFDKIGKAATTAATGVKALNTALTDNPVLKAAMIAWQTYETASQGRPDSQMHTSGGDPNSPINRLLYMLGVPDPGWTPKAPTLPAIPSDLGGPLNAGDLLRRRIEALHRQHDTGAAPDGHITIDINGAPPGTTATVTRQTGVTLRTRIDGDVGAGFGSQLP